MQEVIVTYYERPKCRVNVPAFRFWYFKGSTCKGHKKHFKSKNVPYFFLECVRLTRDASSSFKSKLYKQTKLFSTYPIFWSISNKIYSIFFLSMSFSKTIAFQYVVILLTSTCDSLISLHKVSYTGEFVCFERKPYYVRYSWKLSFLRTLIQMYGGKSCKGRFLFV